ncbi:hybrid sensor histidine kinase/response regulator [Duganella guangzhouensis]|uniref:hybrid sensor histidine kinase/response regulator n=1 Tax=Duganella guangzhouensis TaxID=2666084 RepID=UPI001E4B1712|nr:ATP-binding protein [Duganella guangzhouensis]
MQLRLAWRRNILLRLSFGIFLAVAISTAIYTTYVMQSLHSEAEQKLRERAERLAAVLSQALARPLFDINSAAVSSVVDASGATPEVLVLRVLAPNGAELASYVSPMKEPVASIRVRREIQFADARRSYPVGAIDLAYSRQQMDSDLNRQIFNTVAANLLLALAIVLSIFIVGRRAARPFADIRIGLEKLTRGETDIKLSGIGRADQVGRLSDAVLRFRDTLVRLRDAERALRDLNAELEQRIDARTAELSRSMQMARDSQANLQTIVDTALDAVVRMDLEGRIVGWNRQAEAIFGWKREEALGLELDRTIIPPRFRYDHKRGMLRYLTSGASDVLDTRIEVYALRRNGEEFPIELAITRVRTEEHDSFEFCAFIRDISERREREQKLVTANVMAEAANIAKSEFLANMSHEIRTPMSAVIGMAYLALRTDLTPQQHDYISKIHRAALTLLGIINDILDFSKIEAGRLEVEAIPFALEDVLANVNSVTAQRAADKQLNYRVQVAPQVPAYLVGDPLRLGQVLINLVNNAVKFTLEGELELLCELRGATDDDKAVLRFTVRDSGIGMTPQQKSRLFRAFSQANGSTTRQFGGTGLGLSISQQLVRLMGGNIEVESTVDRGSTFRFDLPFALSDEAALANQLATHHAPAAELTLDAAPQRTARVLLAEDSADNQDVTRDLLRLQGLDVEVVANGREVVERLREAGPLAYDLVLMDLGMPVMDGHEATRLLRMDSRFAELPIIAVTSHALSGVQARCLEEGMQDYITKPIDPQRLYRVLSRWLGISMKVIPPKPPLPESEAAAFCASAADARKALAELAALVAEFSGESVDHFKHARACLGTLLSPQLMARLDHHMEQYEFEAAGKLLAEAIKDQEAS